MDNYKLKKLLSMSPDKIIKKIFKKICQIIKNSVVKFIDLRANIFLSKSTFLTKNTYLSKKTHLFKENCINYSYIDISKIDFSNIDKVAAKYLCEMYLAHSFDLLGSGYVNVTYDMNCRGLEGNIYNGSLHINNFDIEGIWLNKILLKHHLNFAKNIWNHIDIGYIPIDYQMDFKSGYRYSQKKWHLDQPIGKDKGVDIKVPWELARFQHLPQLAIFAILFPQKRQVILMDFRNQMLDFIMTNPKRMGVNWKCTMDVSIRAANMLIAFDMFKQLDEFNILDEFFNKTFNQSIYEHGQFIISNLEWYEGFTGNHYLSDISGLAFVSAYLNRNEEIDSWLQFSVQEIIAQVIKQFNEDGSNFEASTSYHRLSGELLIYSTALIYGILNTDKKEALTKYKSNRIKRLMPLLKQKYDAYSYEFFPKEYIQRIYKSALFTVDITKENENTSQIGDNDSGRFFKFSPNGELLTHSDAIKKYTNLKDYQSNQKKFFDENILNHNTFISAVNGLFDDEKLRSHDRFKLEKSIIKSLCKNKKLIAEPLNYEINSYKDKIFNLEYLFVKELKYKDYTSEVIDINNIVLKSYPFFGLYIFKCDNFYLSVMAGGIGQNGNGGLTQNQGGHGHNDKLSFELNIAGKDIFVDSGTYLYTALPKMRNKFRSVNAHNVPIINTEEQCRFIETFSMENEINCEILSCRSNHLIIYLTYRNIKILREFKINKDKLIIIDSCNKDFQENFNECRAVSNGYGKLMNSQERNIK